MSLLRANDIGVTSGHISMPLSGVWVADLVIDQPDGSGFDAGTAVTIAAEDGFELHGTVQPDRSGSFLDSVHVRVVGGAAGMGKTLTARGYVQPGAFVRDVLNGIAGDAGETLSTDIDAGLLGTNITAWSTFQQTAAQGLNQLLAFIAPTASWRFLADGKLWVGVDSFPSASDSFDIIGQTPSDGTFDLAVTSPSIMPGVTLDGVGKVNRVEHFIDDGALRSHVWVDIGGTDRGAQAAIASIVRQETAGVDYFGLYECKVVSQSADLSTVDVSPLAPVDKKLPGLQRVELRTETGVKVQVSPGAKILLGWKGGNPTLPYAALGLGGDSAIAIQLAGTHPLPFWDTFFSDFVTWIGLVNAVVQSNCAAPGSPLAGAAAYATGIALPSSLVQKMSVTANYQSQKVSNG